MSIQRRVERLERHLRLDLIRDEARRATDAEVLAHIRTAAARPLPPEIAVLSPEERRAKLDRLREEQRA